MSRPIKVLTVSLWVFAVTGMVAVVAMQMRARDQVASGANAAPAVLPISAPAFSLIDQQGRAVTTQDLRGRPWVADFFFTECLTACPIMTQHLAALQGRISPQVRFVSFSVDPDHDTPAALAAYARKYGADNDRWRFLTGDKRDVLAAIAGMKVSIVPAAVDGQIGHDIHYLLVDGSGQLRGVYDSRYPAEVERMVGDANVLAAESKP